MQTTHVASSWIASLRYVPYPRGPHAVVPLGTTGFLIVTSATGAQYAYATPSWVVGLLMAAQANGRSVGKLYNKLVRGRWQSVKVR